MKAKTKIRFKRTVASVLCMMMLVSNLLVTNAATDECDHANYKVDSSSFIGATSLNEGQHKLEYLEVRTCKNCKKTITGTREVWEAHCIGTYTDAGHLGVDAHSYRAHCSKCSFSQLIVIYCPGGSSHVRP